MSVEQQEDMSGRFTKFQEFYFSTPDYITFTAMVLLSTGIGIYFGYFKKKPISLHDMQNEEGVRKRTDFGSSKMNEYLLGSRNLKPFPVAMSLVASYVSGVTILGTASEVYNYGTQYWLVVIAIIFMGIVVSQIYLPVFVVQQVGSSYEYLELRFNSKIRSFLSILFIIDEILFLPLIVYVPSLAFNQVTGFNLYAISAIICIGCVFYTLLGGIKGVVHTDAWQILVMFLAVIVIAILGTIYAGGPVNIFKRAQEGGRIIFANFNPSLYERQTVWSILIGGFCYWTSFNSVNQTMVQRYLSLPSLRKSRQSILMYVMGIVPFVSLCCYSGLLIYDLYHNCDPRAASLITIDDQLLPIYVMQTVGHLQGVPGLFIAGVFGAALSSLSVVLNSTALVVLEDVARGCFSWNLSERGATILVKSCIALLGLIAYSLIFVLEKMEGVLAVATAISGIAASTSFGIFTMGMLIPWTTSLGVLIGGIAGTLLSGSIAFGSQWMFLAGKLKPHRLPVSVSECLANVTVVVSGSDDSEVFPLFRLSFMWVNVIGILTTITIGVIASFVTGANKVKNIEGDLLSPVIHRYLPAECFPPPRGTRTQDNSARLLNDTDKATKRQ